MHPTEPEFYEKSDSYTSVESYAGYDIYKARLFTTHKVVAVSESDIHSRWPMKKDNADEAIERLKDDIDDYGES